MKKPTGVVATVKGVAVRLLRKAQRSSPPEWKPQKTSDNWRSIRNPELAATRQARIARLWIGAILATGAMACLAGVLSFAFSTGARSTAAASMSLAQETRREAEARGGGQAIRSESSAHGALLAVLRATDHPMSAYQIRDADLSEVIEGHPAGEVWEVPLLMMNPDGRSPLRAHVAVIGGEVMGITFRPRATTHWLSEWPAGVPLWGQAEAQRWAAVDLDSADALSAKWPSIMNGGVTYKDFPALSSYVMPVTPEIRARVDTWLSAWASDDQETMREIGDHRDPGRRCSWGVPNWSYAPNSLNPQSMFANEDYRWLHARFAMQGPQGAYLVNDLLILLRQDDALLRVLDAFNVASWVDAPRAGGDVCP